MMSTRRCDRDHQLQFADLTCPQLFFSPSRCFAAVHPHTPPAVPATNSLPTSRVSKAQRATPTPTTIPIAVAAAFLNHLFCGRSSSTLDLSSADLESKHSSRTASFSLCSWREEESLLERRCWSCSSSFIILVSPDILMVSSSLMGCSTCSSCLSIMCQFNYDSKIIHMITASAAQKQVRPYPCTCEAPSHACPQAYAAQQSFPSLQISVEQEGPQSTGGSHDPEDDELGVLGSLEQVDQDYAEVEVGGCDDPAQVEGNNQPSGIELPIFFYNLERPPQDESDADHHHNHDEVTAHCRQAPVDEHQVPDYQQQAVYEKVEMSFHRPEAFKCLVDGGSAEQRKYHDPDREEVPRRSDSQDVSVADGSIAPGPEKVVNKQTGDENEEEGDPDGDRTSGSNKDMNLGVDILHRVVLDSFHKCSIIMINKSGKIREKLHAVDERLHLLSQRLDHQTSHFIRLLYDFTFTQQ